MKQSGASQGQSASELDIHEGEEVDESAFKALVRQAVALNSSGKMNPLIDRIAHYRAFWTPSIALNDCWRKRTDDCHGPDGSPSGARATAGRMMEGKLADLLARTPEPPTHTWRRRSIMKIRLNSIYVDDQEKALRFYTDVLGFVKKADFSQGAFRWLTVASPEEPDGTELQLALNDKPAARTYQQALFQQGQPAAMFFTDDVQADYERIRPRGAEFTMPPTKVTGSTIAMVNDTCGNLIQLTQQSRQG
jgi:predicted enzyme related to lactoylglutathione lyase